MRINYIIIPLVTILVAVIGSFFSANGVRTWYHSIKRPSWTPPGRVIGAVWTVLYILSAIAALMVWNLLTPPANLLLIGAVFILNAIVNIFWSYVFFYMHKIRPAIWVSLFLDVTVVALIELIAPSSLVAAWLLVPYAVWVTFASYLNYRIAQLNPRRS